jgi:uroporphyrin-III C-methyltransferase / precorrin-2 dehydrogenase / sirohydrochlorin ferrochelatase
VLLINSHSANWDALSAMSGTIVLLMAVERIEIFAEAC